MVVPTTEQQKTPVQKLRILCLHGYEQDSSIFKMKLRQHENALREKAEFVYVDAPNILCPYDIDGMDNMARAADAKAGNTLDRTLRGWYWLKSAEPEVICGLESSIAYLESVINHQGPFDGILGFSQGGLMAGLMCALLERRCKENASSGNEHGHFLFRFVVIASGYKLKDSKWTYLYDEPICTPSLHLYGVLDLFIHAGKSIELRDAFVQPREYSFIGTHFVPKVHDAIRTIQQFIEQFA
ncbi:hypothetical protein COEREDRAFT_89824 [Coemansia reversa NRRL 1564]|uniref:Serine hydrolase domain-containing protein n=1 Tax=Coemansia reversa (strain ATCC 12441 / NRRL 1564) TaxID=763665 RepID=A0A2G5B2B2_COERN|nr:hypothetical protein COEREDRAFT_89824 [Coemansia reversa NRRL 1564]|eukprot:PIA13131.1 hypothetical protein COEREDRAFT_89824 [Coemansia reversa NRRL 1564]